MTTPIVSISSPQIVVTNTGQRGNSWLSGVGVPSNSLGIDGDFYLDTTNVGVFYGPRAGGVWGSSHAFATPLTNYSSTVDPLATNDGTQGYTRGSVWINTVKNVYYVCAQNTTNAAVWDQALLVGATAGGDLSGPYPSPTVSKVNGVTVTGTPSTGTGLFASSSTTAAWSVGLGQSTGLISGGQLTFNSTTAFNIAAGTAQVIDYITTPSSPTIARVTISSQTITLTGTQLAQTANWYGIDGTGTIVTQFTPFTPTQRRSIAQIGVVPCVGGAITRPISVPQYDLQVIPQLYDHMNGLGAFNASGASGNTISANGANLQLNFLTGQLFQPGFNYATDPNNPHNITTLSETPAGFFYVTRNAGSEVPSTAINPTVFDNNGTLTSVGGGTSSSTLQRVYLFGSKLTGQQLVIQYGNTVFPNLSSAVSAAGTGSFPVNPDISNNGGLLIAYLAVGKTCLSFLDTTTSSIMQAAKFANP